MNTFKNETSEALCCVNSSVRESTIKCEIFHETGNFDGVHFEFSFRSDERGGSGGGPEPVWSDQIPPGPSLPVPSVRVVIWTSLPSDIHERCLVCSDQGSSHLHQTKVNLRPEERLWNGEPQENRHWNGEPQENRIFKEGAEGDSGNTCSSVFGTILPTPWIVLER